MIHKLQRRFILIAMVSVTLVIVLLTLSINTVNFISTNAGLNDMLEVICRNQGTLPEMPKDVRPGGGKDIHFTPETPYSTRYFVLRYTQDGILLNANLRNIAAVTEADAEEYLDIALEHGEGFSYCGSYKYYVSASGDGRYMAVFLDCTQELRSVRIFALASALAGAACIALVYLLILFFSRRAIDPVVKSAEKQKQFITDASHELKTPLTVITTSLKVLEMEVGPQKWIDKIQTQTDRMSELVNDMVTLSRLDEEQPDLQMADFNISQAVTETAESFLDFAAARGRTLELDIQPELNCRGNEYSIRQLVSVLLENAVKYASADGYIRLSLHQDRKELVLQTLNPCEQMDPGELERLFDRFYRVEKSRSRQTGGSGVGLSIARGIAEAHRGSIRAQCPADGIIQFTVTLPVRQRKEKK